MEPHDIITVSRRPPVGMDKPRTLQDYQANLVRRFGRVPSWTELAKRENAKARASLNPNMPVNRPSSEVARTARQMTYRAIQEARTRDIRQKVLEALWRPLTASDVARQINRDQSVIRKQLVMMENLGMVTGRKVKSVTVWERRKEAAE